MEIDTQQEQPVPSENEINRNSIAEKLFAGPVAYKVVLASVVIGIIVVCVLWVFVARQAGNQNSMTPLTIPDIKTQEKAESTELINVQMEYEAIHRKLELVSNRIDENTSVQIERSAFVKNEITAMSDSINVIKAMITTLEVSHEEIGRQINESNSGLNALAKDVQALKVVKHKLTTRNKAKPVKKPPFVIDAIDVWDDVSYVAISQAGQVSFLKVGDQQSGWMLTQIDHSKEQVSFKGSDSKVYTTSVQR